jgi:hypothetical protein
MPSILIKPSKFACLLFIAGACVIPSGCARPAPPRVEEKSIPIMATPTPQTAAAQSDSAFPPPEPAEVKQSIERVFKGAVTIQTDWNPYFFDGDFNGDFSKDLAVVVKPTPGKLLVINDELAAWILVNPFQFAKPIPKELSYADVHAEKMRRRRVTVSEGDILLAVIHGFQSKGWRDPQATQTYVLKDAVGARIRVQARKQIVWAGNEERLPRVWGDVIAESISEQHGFLYYNGAKYAWYDPRTYEPDAPTKTMGHGRASRAMR